MTEHETASYLLSRFSHELRNPLTTAYSTIQLIEAQHPEVRSFKYWAELNRDFLYINTLMDELSDLTKAKKLKKSSFSAKKLLEQVSLSFSSMLANTNIKYTFRISSSIHQIIGDKTKLQEVFRNLLKNAYDASLPDKSITFEASKAGKMLCVRVSDTGCGIPENQLESIFDPFVTYKSQGTGLGLSVSSEIVKAHGGFMTVKSKEGEGSVFEVFLPIS